MIPVSIVTGFLGSGKTTLIARLLRDPAFTRTAVIVNEWGEVGLDHDLIAQSDESLVALATGCLCCAVRSDLAATLLDLQQRRLAGDIIPYDRVVIETSGLADPGPILQSLIADRDLTAGHKLAGVLTLVDAVHGGASLMRHAEARRQVAFADRILLSKTDIVLPDRALLHAVDGLNPHAPREVAIKGAASPNTLFGSASEWHGALRRGERAQPRATGGIARGRHAAGIDSFVMLWERPIPALALSLWLQALTAHCGERLLRVKGLISLKEMPEAPALIQGVRHFFAQPEWLERWPSEDRRSRLVFIVQGIVPRHFPQRLLAAIEEEVLEESGEHTAATGPG